MRHDACSTSCVERAGQRHWRPGEHVVVRSRLADRWGFIIPATVVVGDSDRIELYLSAGTPFKRIVLFDGSSLPRVLSPQAVRDLPMKLIDDTWRDRNILYLSRPGAAYAVHASWSASDWSFRGWYVNLQSPLRRTGVGFESTDHFLDIVVNPDLTWRWKDEDELDEAVAVGRMSAEDAVVIRAEGERVVEDIKARRWPFNGEYETWRPDPSWSIPEMPANWDAL